MQLQSRLLAQAIIAADHPVKIAVGGRHPLIMPVTGMVSQAARHPVAVIYPANSKEIRFGSYITTYASTDKRIFGRSIAKGVVFRRVGPVQASHRQIGQRSEEHTSELQSRGHLVCRLLLEKKKTKE